MRASVYVFLLLYVIYRMNKAWVCVSYPVRLSWDDQWEAKVYIAVISRVAAHYLLCEMYSHTIWALLLLHCVQAWQTHTWAPPPLSLSITSEKRSITSAVNSRLRSKLQLNFHSWNSTNGALWPTSPWTPSTPPSLHPQPDSQLTKPLSVDATTHSADL